ncbi:polysaccharide biosynthesis protein [Alkalihalobacillus sp. MEB130]|uniref:putative polysaccharide biosynthesis protein n=1 Tax=Alkalihalobacillus sp. MEB130 TaxID=2976704 RepID=UPI0028DF4326|nr:polysaccharide biosynthesis protein [Alkalihalobacillus sp. MEB130]MDT8862651.1 polysaccharide biosynthesis protein [Alkalihalobacillus sp. MEB130]
MKNRDLLQGVAFLSAAALLAKVLSAVYRIPYQNLSGDIGYYVYQQIYPLYGIVITLAMYGFPVVLSKQRSELLAKGYKEEARGVTSLLFYGLVLFSFLSWIVLFLLAPWIAQMMGDENLTRPIRAMSYVLLLLPFLSIGRGYHQGEGELMPTAVSHIVEQFVRVLLILGFTYLFVTIGYDAYQIGAGAAYGSFFGGLTGIIVLLIWTKAVWMKQLVHPKKIKVTGILKHNIEIMKHSLFICLSALMFVLIQLVDAFTIVQLLQKSGVPSTTAYIAKGVYDRGQPLLQLGTVVTTTLSLALVPMISKAIAENKQRMASKYQDLSYRLTFLIGGAATVGLVIIIEPTNHMLFTNVTGTDVLRVLSLAVVGSSFFVTISAVLQGYNLAYLPAIAVAVGITVKLILNVLLVPYFGTIGAAWSTVVAIVMMVIYLLISLKKKKQLSIGSYGAYGRIVLIFILMGFVTALWKKGITAFFATQDRFIDTVIALTSAGIGGLVVACGLFTFAVFTEEEWSKIPKLNKIRERVLRRRR